MPPHSSKSAVLIVHGFNDPYAKDGPPGLSLQRGVRACDRWRSTSVYDYTWSSGTASPDIVDLLNPTLRELIGPVRDRVRAYNVAVRRAQEIEANRFHRQLEALMREGYESVDFVAHSLGAHVVRSGLMLADDATLQMVENVYVVGGAVQSFRSWWSIATRIGGTIYNFSSKHDDVLAVYHKWYLNKGQINPKNGRPIGLPSAHGTTEAKRGIDTRLRNVHNLDISSALVKHDYGRLIPEIVDEFAPGVPPRTCRLQGGWRDEFYWDPAPVSAPLSARRRSRGATVEIVQRALTTLPEGTPGRVPAAAVDGIFGPTTRDAVRGFQHAHGQRADGIVGAETWAALVGEPTYSL
jgi:hypothetical protein